VREKVSVPSDAATEPSDLRDQFGGSLCRAGSRRGPEHENSEIGSGCEQFAKVPKDTGWIPFNFHHEGQPKRVDRIFFRPGEIEHPFPIPPVSTLSPVDCKSELLTKPPNFILDGSCPFRGLASKN